MQFYLKKRKKKKNTFKSEETFQALDNKGSESIHLD